MYERLLNSILKFLDVKYWKLIHKINFVNAFNTFYSEVNYFEMENGLLAFTKTWQPISKAVSSTVHQYSVELSAKNNWIAIFMYLWRLVHF